MNDLQFVFIFKNLKFKLKELSRMMKYRNYCLQYVCLFSSHYRLYLFS